MKSYEVTIEYFNPCAGPVSRTGLDVIEVETDDPEAYVWANGIYDVKQVSTNTNGDTVIFTGDGNGYSIKYTFSE